VEPSAGSAFGPYRIVDSLGRGGMASVYRAHDTALDRQVALKVLPAEFLHDPAFAERFRQEARVAAKLEHPHIVPVHAFGIEQEWPWMAMRLVSGGSLAQRVKRGPLPPREVAALLRDVAAALDYAHARGIVHRDVKPANVLLDDAGRAYLADFGIARMLEGSSVATATGLIQGTPSYMAPEQAMGARVDRRADVYALGVMAFECLTGRVPYTGTTPVAILMKHVQEPVPEPTEDEVAPPLAAVLRRCLAKAPGDRWPTAGAFVEALGQAAAGPTPVGLASLPTLEVAPTPVPGTPRAGAVALPPAAPSAVRRNLAWAAGGGLVALVLLAAAGAVLLPRLPGWAPTASPGAAPPATPAAAPVEVASAPVPPPPARASAPTTSLPRRPAASASPRPTLAAATPTPAPAEGRPPAAASPSGSSAPDALPPPGAQAQPLARSGPIRVFCEAKLEPVQFRKTREKDVADSLEDLEEAIAKRAGLELVPSRARAEAVVQVLERGREPAVVGMRKVRVRVVVGRESVELLGQDSMTGFNTWSGAAGGAAKRVEEWLERRLGSPGDAAARR
jgi:eukaryotic-like serine/threonine-protein kinase